MPQVERSEKIKELLAWIEAKSKGKQRGVTMQEIVRHTQLEITELGATGRTVRGYARSLIKHRLIQGHGIRFKISSQGKNWLRRKKIS